MSTEGNAVLSPGRRLAGRYRVISRVPGGALGPVARGRDLRTGEEVALRLLRRASHPEELRRLRRSIDLRRQIYRAALPPVVDLIHVERGDAAGPLLVTVWVEGTPLDAWSAAGDAADLSASWPALAEALTAGHGMGLTHGAVAAHNILVRPEAAGSPRLVLLDHGLGGLRDGATPEGDRRDLEALVRRLAGPEAVSTLWPAPTPPPTSPAGRSGGPLVNLAALLAAALLLALGLVLLAQLW